MTSTFRLFCANASSAFRFWLRHVTDSIFAQRESVELEVELARVLEPDLAAWSMLMDTHLSVRCPQLSPSPMLLYHAPALSLVPLPTSSLALRIAHLVPEEGGFSLSPLPGLW